MNLIKSQDFTDAYMEQLEERDDSKSDEDDDDIQLQKDRQFINGTVNSMNSNYKLESIGEFVPLEFNPSTSMTEENVSFRPLTTSGRLNSDFEKLQPKNCDTVNLESKVRSTPLTTSQSQGESTEQFSPYTSCKNYNSSTISPDRDSDENIVRRHDFYESEPEIGPRNAANLFSDETEPMPTKHSIYENQYLAIQDTCDKTSILAYNLIGHIMEEFAITESLNLKF